MTGAFAFWITSCLSPISRPRSGNVKVVGGIAAAASGLHLTIFLPTCSSAAPSLEASDSREVQRIRLLWLSTLASILLPSILRRDQSLYDEQG